MSTNLIGESVSQKAMMGMFPKAPSLIGCNTHKTLINTTRHQLVYKFYRRFYLVVSSWVSKNQQPGFTEGCLHLIGEGTRSVPSSNGIGSSVLSKLQDGSLSIGPSRLNNDVLWVLNGNNNSSSHLELIPCFAKVEDVNT